MAHITRGWTTYTNSFSNQASLKCVGNTATQNGTAFGKKPPVSTLMYGKTKDLRHVYGSDSAGDHTDSMVAMSQTSPIMSIGAGWTDSVGNSYNTTGIRNERFKLADLI